MPISEPGPIRAFTTGISRPANDIRDPAPNGLPASRRAPDAPVTTGALADASTPPVDTDRVAEIRKAIENGNYPLLPHRVADAMIAAGILLRTSK